MRFTQDKLLQFREVVDVPEDILKIKQEIEAELFVKIKIGVWEKAICQINLRVVILSQIIVTGVAGLHSFLPLERRGHGLTLDSGKQTNLIVKTN